MLRAIVLLLVLTIVPLTGCSDTTADTVDANGSYSISLTSKENGCSFENWMEGNTSTGVPIEIAQEEESADATVGGVAATYLDIVLGSHVFSGEVSGNHLDLVLNGTRETQSQGCAYFVNAKLDARLEGDLLEGQLIYSVIDNGSPDCQALQGCASVQDFNGTRPPQ
jgi:hypothetical protein